MSTSIIINVIIKKGRQCKAGRERLTRYQSEDPSQTRPTHRMQEEKGNRVGDKKGARSQSNKKALSLLVPHLDQVMLSRQLYTRLVYNLCSSVQETLAESGLLIHCNYKASKTLVLQSASRVMVNI